MKKSRHSLLKQERKSVADDNCVMKVVCNNCNKQLKSLRAIGMHLKLTGGLDHVNFIDHGDYEEDSGLRKQSDTH
jgi:hypothetical protein